MQMSHTRSFVMTEVSDVTCQWYCGNPHR